MTQDDFSIPNSDDISPADIQPYADLSGVDLSGADLTGATLSSTGGGYGSFGSDGSDGADLSRVMFSIIDLSNANLSDADLTGASLVGADLTGVSLDDVQLTNSQLVDAPLTDAQLKNLDLARAAVWLRESGVIDEDVDPPVAVLAAVADQAGLHTDRGDGLGAHASVARAIFDNLDAGNI